jgi:ketosteroid isomerase-like protein
MPAPARDGERLSAALARSGERMNSHRRTITPFGAERGTPMGDTLWIYEVAAAIEAHDGERAAAFFAEDGSFEAVSINLRISGRPALAEMFGPSSDGFSTDEQFEVESAVSDGEVFALQWHDRGTRISDGEKYNYRGASVGQLSDGLITRWTDYFDPAQIGLTSS